VVCTAGRWVAVEVAIAVMVIAALISLTGMSIFLSVSLPLFIAGGVLFGSG
jgi:hypothetical protein